MLVRENMAALEPVEVTPDCELGHLKVLCQLRYARLSVPFEESHDGVSSCRYERIAPSHGVYSPFMNVIGVR